MTVSRQLLARGTRTPDLPLHRVRIARRVDLRPHLRVPHRSRGLHYGRRRVQGEVVRSVLGTHPERVQRLHQQLLEHPLRAPATRLPQVRDLSVTLVCSSLTRAADMTSSRRYVCPTSFVRAYSY